MIALMTGLVSAEANSSCASRTKRYPTYYLEVE